MLTFIHCIMVLGSVIWCRVFAVIFAIVTKVCHVFCRFLPWFSAVPNHLSQLDNKRICFTSWQQQQCRCPTTIQCVCDVTVLLFSDDENHPRHIGCIDPACDVLLVTEGMCLSHKSVIVSSFCQNCRCIYRQTCFSYVPFINVLVACWLKLSDLLVQW